MRTDVRPGPEIWVRGPVTDARAEADGWEGRPERPAGRPVTPRRFSWLATHGGAGTTTLAAVYGGHDCGRAWPGPGAPESVLLVARTHAAGLDAVTRALEVFRGGEAPAGLDLDAVVLVADAPGRLPRRLAQRVKPIESVIDVYRVPWVEAWRLGDLSGAPPRESEPLARLTGAGSARAVPTP
ncbi:DUF6668 family protein [Streptomyces sp. 6-11-2]|uniref:DUF6668 family protein n=1 Tax=unclassified Streptomyces TaxID=2593676 RepID=UPI0011426A6E|nr:DUF6668 family protein [Streptomyces sp. 6-11-2]GED85426.1 hypothetical protein TNCT6_25110 [Streptomyces sp. 6-11-2]